MDHFLYGLQMLPETMQTNAARAFLIAIGLQESRFTHRRQIKGPARGFWQFEKPTLGLMLKHERLGPCLRDLCKRMQYSPDEDTLYTAIEHNDALAVCIARLLLWTVPRAMPGPADAKESWEQYLWAWKPGKPKPDTWNGFWEQAWRMA